MGMWVTWVPAARSALAADARLLFVCRGAIAAVSLNASCLGNIGKKSFERGLGTFVGGWLGFLVALARIHKLRGPVRPQSTSSKPTRLGDVDVTARLWSGPETWPHAPARELDWLVLRVAAGCAQCCGAIVCRVRRVCGVETLPPSCSAASC